MIPEGLNNFRDLTGRGRLFRSGHLGNLTPAGRKALLAMGIRRIFDLRSEQERKDAPMLWLEGEMDVQCVPMGLSQMKDGLGAFVRRLVLMNESQAKHLMCDMMAHMAIEEADQLGQICRSLASSPEPALIHCTAGKDRTGLASAILLKLIGATEEAIYYDYLLSNQATAPKLPLPLQFIRPSVLRVLLGVEREYLESAFAAIQSAFGSFECYESKRLGLNGVQLQRIQHF